MSEDKRLDFEEVVKLYSESQQSFINNVLDSYYSKDEEIINSDRINLNIHNDMLKIMKEHKENYEEKFIQCLTLIHLKGIKFGFEDNYGGIIMVIFK